MASRVETAPRPIPRKVADVARQAGVEIVSWIGSGSQGELFHATLNRRAVALKVFHSSASVDVSVLERFVQGRDDTLRHPKLMPILDVYTVAVSLVDDGSRSKATSSAGRGFGNMRAEGTRGGEGVR